MKYEKDFDETMTLATQKDFERMWRMLWGGLSKAEVFTMISENESTIDCTQQLL